MKTIKIEGCVIEISYDDDCDSPCEYEELVQLACWHRKYRLGHYKKYSEFTSPANLLNYFGGEKKFNESHVVMPLYLYDHSGITISTKPFTCNWDSGQVGWAFMSRDDVHSNFGWKKLTKKRLTILHKAIALFVKHYDQFLTGECYYVTISLASGKEESCGGFIGMESVKDFIAEYVTDKAILAEIFNQL